MSKVGQRKAVSVGGPPEELIHNECLGEIGQLLGLGLYCVQCGLLVGFNETERKPNNSEIPIVD